MVPDQPDRIEASGETAPDAVDASPFDVGISFGSANPLPTDVLSPEAIERLRAGGAPSSDDLERLRSAASADSGIAGMLLEGLLAAGFTEVHDEGGAEA